MLLRWALAFFVVAFIAAVLGFGGLAAGAADVAKAIFYVFCVLAIVSAALHATLP